MYTHSITRVSRLFWSKYILGLISNSFKILFGACQSTLHTIHLIQAKVHLLRAFNVCSGPYGKPFVCPSTCQVFFSRFWARSAQNSLDAHLVSHLFGWPNFSPFSKMEVHTMWCFIRSQYGGREGDCCTSLLIWYSLFQWFNTSNVCFFVLSFQAQLFFIFYFHWPYYCILK